MFIGDGRTFYDMIQIEEIRNYYNSLDGQSVSINTSDHRNKIKNGSILFNVDISSPFINSLMHYQGFAVKPQHCNLTHTEYLFNNVTNQLLQVSGVYNLKDSLGIIANFVEKAGTHFYGALLKSGDTLLNPLHPLTVPILLGNYDQFNERGWSVILYFYSDRHEMDSRYRTAQADIEIIKTEIDCIYNSVTQDDQSTAQNNAYIKVRDTNQLRALIDIVEEVSITDIRRRLSNPLSKDKNMLVAHQMMTDGITAPYYGTTLLSYSQGDRSLGGHLSPFRSCNISYEGSSDTASRSSDLRYLKVCTGSKSSGSIEGLHTLVHSNLASAYTKYNIADGALAYSDACVIKALQVFKLAGIINSEVSELITPPPPPTLATPEVIEAYTNDRVNFLKELREKCTRDEFVAILQAIRKQLDQ